MLFFSFFKTLVGHEVAVELKNGVVIRGVLVSVDQYLNVKLKQIKVDEIEKHPQFYSLRNCFIRGSTIRYIQIPQSQVDVELLQDAARKESAGTK